ncbi:hypothetical protein KKF82_05375 [Patescibacteria group bacterium]|nr:hypothetical protein [Patescibacteria group bacterium]
MLTKEDLKLHKKLLRLCRGGNGRVIGEQVSKDDLPYSIKLHQNGYTVLISSVSGNTFGIIVHDVEANVDLWVPAALADMFK